MREIADLLKGVGLSEYAQSLVGAAAPPRDPNDDEDEEDEEDGGDEDDHREPAVIRELDEDANNEPSARRAVTALSISLAVTSAGMVPVGLPLADRAASSPLLGSPLEFC